MGLPPPGIDLAVIDDDGERLPIGQEGDLAVAVKPERPVGLFQGYYRNDTATAKAFRNGFPVAPKTLPVR